MPKVPPAPQIKSEGAEAPAREERVKSSKKNTKTKLLILLVVILVIVGGGYFAFKNISLSGAGGSSDWQAVFLINGQVYFGHVVKETSRDVVLREIYYLQVTGPLQQRNEQGQQRPAELSLIKLGNELHGPRDEMRIVRNNVLFIEDLKPDSKVVTAIEKYLSEKEGKTEE